MDHISFSEKDLKFRLPFGMIVFGSSSSGKTFWLKKLLKNLSEMIDPEPVEIVYAYGEYNNVVPYFKKRGIITHAGIPNMEFLSKCKKPLLLLLDDLMLSATNPILNELYTKTAHHQNIGVIFVTQNLFDKDLRIIRQNSQYILVMRAPNAGNQIQTLGIQIFPQQLSYFLDAYKKATFDPYGYILIDLHPATNTFLRLRTSIFPGEEHTVFLPKNGIEK